jgi:hypothetical protein
VPHALGGCRLKLERAVLHVETLNKAIQRFREPTTHELVRDFDPETEETVWWVEGINDDPPAAWSPLVGDILHNFHSALDHLAWQLALRRNYGHALPAEYRAMFPIFKNKTKFWRKRPDGRWTGLSGANSLLRFPGDARKLVLAVQPYKNGQRSPEHPLWVLHALSNEDKHKTLHVVQSAMVDSALQIDELDDARIEHFMPIQGRIRGRTEIGRLKIEDTGPNVKVKLQPAFAVGEAFGDEVPFVAGRYIGEVVNEIAKYVIDTVFRAYFAPYFGVDDWDDWRLTPGDPRNKATP